MFWNKKKKAEEAREAKLAEVRDAIADLLKKDPALSQKQERELKFLIAVSKGQSAASLKIAQTIQKADAFGDKLHDQTMKMIEEAHAMTAAAGQPTDPQALLEAVQRLREAAAVAAGTPVAPSDSQQQADWRRQGCPVTADVTVGKPLKLKPRRP